MPPYPSRFLSGRLTDRSSKHWPLLGRLLQKPHDHHCQANRSEVPARAASFAPVRSSSQIKYRSTLPARPANQFLARARWTIAFAHNSLARWAGRGGAGLLGLRGDKAWPDAVAIGTKTGIVPQPLTLIGFKLHCHRLKIKCSAIGVQRRVGEAMRDDLANLVVKSASFKSVEMHAGFFVTERKTAWWEFAIAPY